MAEPAQEQGMQFDSEGFLVDKNQWTKELANEVATQQGIELTEQHWTVVNAARDIEQEAGATPGLRKLSKLSNVPIKALYGLFPNGPAKQIAKIAGIPKPKSCL